MTDTAQKTFTVTLTERQIGTLKSYALSQELKETYQSRPDIVKFYSDLFNALNDAEEV
jgi:hypothetical protein